MRGVFKVGTAFLVGLVVTTAGFWLGYEIYEPSNSQPLVYANDANNLTLTLNNKEVVREDTVIKYVYNYLGDGISEVYEDLPSYYMLGLARDEFGECMEGWTLESFGSDAVVLCKSVEGDSTQHYVVNVGEDGYIEVHYTQNGKIVGLREKTNTPINILDEEFKKKIVDGYEIVGRENLNDFLENIES